LEKIIAILILIALSSCRTAKISVSNIKDFPFCGHESQIENLILNDSATKDHFNMTLTQLNIKYDTLINSGIPYFFQYQVAKLRSEKYKIGIDSIFSNLEKKYIENQNMRYAVNCFKLKDLQGEVFEVGFWYSKTDSLMTVDIQQKHSDNYNSGYLFLLKLNSKKEIEIVSRTFWNE
jgi:hypothetical protein